MGTGRLDGKIRHVRVLVILAATLACAGCAGSGGNDAATTVAATETSESTTEEESTTVAEGPGPQVVAWARLWRRKIDQPMRKAGKTFVRNALAAVEGNSTANFRVSGPVLDTLSNCRNPLERRLMHTPSKLRSARRLTLNACRLAFVGVDKFIKGWNQTNLQGSSAESQALVDDGLASVKKALKLLGKAEDAVAKATAG